MSVCAKIAYNWVQRPKIMKSVFAFASVCLFLLAAGCSQSPEKLLATANKYHDNKKYDEASILYQKVLVKDKTNAEAYYRLGLNYLDQGKVPDAVQALRRAVDLNAANTDAEAKLAEIYLTAYVNDPVRFKRALGDINDLDAKILKQNPNSFEGLRIEGLVAFANKDFPKAQEILGKANSVKPHSRELVGWYAQALAQGGKPDEAVSLVNDMLARDKSWGAGYDFLLMMYARAGQRDKAEAILKQRVTADPKSAAGIENYANYRLALGDFAGAEQIMKKVLGDPKAFPDGQMLMGDFYARAHKPDQAITSFEQGEKDNPKQAVKYQERIVAIQASTNHGDQALKMAKDLVDKNPKDVSANEMYALVLLQTMNRQTASHTLDEIKHLMDNNPGNSLLHLDLARAYLATNDTEKALSSAQEAVTEEQKSGHAKPAILIPSQTLIARVYSDRGEAAKALDEISLVLNMRPNDPEALLIKDRCLVATGQSDKATPDLEMLTQRYPTLAEPHVLLGNTYLNQKQFDKANAQFEILAKATPPDSRGFLGLQTVKLVSGHAPEAIQALQDISQKNPGDPTVRFELANFEVTAAAMPQSGSRDARLKLLSDAADNYKEILKTNPKSSQLWLRLGAVQRTLNQSDAALASFEEAGKVDPKSRDAFLNEAMLLDALQRKKEAADAYNKVLNLEPDNALALNNLAYLSAESGTNLDQAQTYAERAKKKAPNSPEVSDTLGYVYLQKNLNTQAAEIFRQNVAEHPDNASFRFHLAMALLKEGDKQGAKDQASRALQGANPDLQNKIKNFVGQIG